MLRCLWGSCEPEAVAYPPVVGLAAVGEVLVWSRRGDSHLDWRMKMARYLLNECVDERCLDQMKKGKKKAATPKSLIYLSINHKNNCKKPWGCLCSVLSQFQ